ncbi:MULTISPECIES: bifunctional rhamnulose-1-phosphate aldolase/short-chain dehydrogenase [Deinococcus]|uniref:Bifunctional rhamnulose-1-phosphate aldolase/alcohol dehydrogenase n=1 Tax=Deinococcus geothermalis (strain DSM 11300 / CIP 105573 / AG-3a) TaxID=319795 RepID=Q1J3P6_DEIGD|nr:MULTISPECIES: bifunctional rhamnulose-1-phosphate aldolase/short-chain dehydrogenase [Deinococcus]ABF43888.1 Bifunctional rhamnulose-1-phosphate aldolase/alcohol dehydrogenase [Deinococcus geothermalis DSM 11300]TDE84854.1 bifunctional rhamnulose-1-phosphate aldolase/short-chain dehydrogenase [Deinococcus sp. S9]
MTTTHPQTVIPNRWNDAEAPQGDGLTALTYRSRLLGADRRLVNIYGGNTSTKSVEKDHLGRDVTVLWVKGSGSDIATITEQGFAGLKLDEVLPLFGREHMTDEEMTAYLERTTFEPGRPRQSIETLLHAFVPAKHVDHTHPDAIIAIACTPRGQEIVREIYGDRAAWVDYIRPGFTLSKQIGEAVRKNPRLEAVVMGKHGLVTWGNTAKESYENTLRIIREAQAYLDAHREAQPFGGARVSSVPEETAKVLLASVLPVLRGAMKGARPVILTVDRSPEVMAFVNSNAAAALSQVGAACPDHLVHTKRVPLFLDWTPDQGQAALLQAAREGVERFKAEYTAYFEENRHEGDVMFSPSPRVILIPGLGMVSSGPDAQGADVSRQLYLRAIQVMQGASSLGGFVSLTAAESYAVEYWPLELYKLAQKPAPKVLEGHVALVTGAASGIGRAIARRLSQDGAHVVIADLNAEGGQQVAGEITAERGYRRAVGVPMDVTDETQVQAAYQTAILEYGGVDIVVNNAGIASSAPIEDTSLEMWNRNQSILSTGYFLVAREAFRILKAQGTGGNLVFIGSKNALAAGKNAAAYSAAKAAEIHLARCLAEEGGAAGIRVNSVLPDSVLSGSAIWDGKWRAERAATYGIREDQLEEFYRQRNTLKVNILPEDIAEATFFFATPAASKTTGGILTVDGGVPLAYVR